MKRAIKSLILVAAAAVVLAPAQARADGWVTPWIGTAFGSSIDNGRGTFGVSAGGMGAGIVGGEVDFGYNPSFFGTQNDFGNSSVLNVMGNLIVGVPIGGTHGMGLRPYIVGGVGLIRTQVDANSNLFRPAASDNMFGWDAGAGVMGFFNDHIGLRGELRYLRGTHDMNTSTGVNSVDFNGNKIHFWRPSIGVVFR